MIVKLISILAALGAATVSASAAAAANFVMGFRCDAGDCKVSKIDDPKTCGAALFLDDHTLCFNRDYLGDILNRAKRGSTLDKTHVEMLLYHYGGISHQSGELDDIFGLMDRGNLAKNLMEKLSKDTVGQFTAFPESIKYHIDLLGGDVLASSDPMGLLRVIPGNASGDKVFVAALNKLASVQAGPKVIRDNSNGLLAAYNARSGRIPAEYLTPEVWKSITDNGDDCKDLTGPTLSALLQSPNHAKILKSNCIREPLKVSDGCGVQIRNMPLEVIKNCPPMEPKCYEYLSTEQVAVLDEGKPEDERCLEYPLVEKVVRANGSKMTPTCFEGALAAIRDGSHTGIGTAWQILPTNILTFKEPQNYEKLGGDDLHHIPATHKSPIFASIEGCERAPPEILTYHAKGVRISSACFKMLRSGNQLDSVIGADVDKDCLKEATIDKTKEWVKGDDKGLVALNHALDREDIAELIAHLNPEVCATIEDLDTLKNALAIQLYGRKECFNEMKEALSKVRLSDLRDLETNARTMVDMNEFIKAMSDENYSNMTKEDFQMLQDSSEICDVMKGDQASSLPSEVLVLINGSCLAKILSRGEVVERRALVQIPPTSFTKLEAEHLKLIKDSLTPEQFGMASSEVASLEHHFASTWGSADVAKIPADNMRHIHVSAWKAAPEEAYAGFNKQNFAKIPAADIRVMTLKKLQQVPQDVRATLTETQAKELDPTTLEAFTGLQLPAAVQKILDEALAAHKPKAEEAPQQPAAEPQDAPK